MKENPENKRRKTVEAFDRASASYDMDFTRTFLGQYFRARVQDRLDVLFKPGMLVLDIGCGTGDDAIHLAKRGVHVIGCDFSSGMLNQAVDKIRKAGVTRDVELRELSVERLEKIIEELPCGFDGLYSNFGPLNVVEDLSSFVRLSARLLDPGAKALHVVMNRRPFFEMFYYLCHWRTHRAFARCKGHAYVTVGGTPLKSMFYSPSEFTGYFKHYFSCQRVEALGLILPPPFLTGHFRRRRNFYTRLLWLDKTLSRAPVLNCYGDHFIVELTRTGNIIYASI